MGVLDCQDAVEHVPIEHSVYSSPSKRPEFAWSSPISKLARAGDHEGSDSGAGALVGGTVNNRVGTESDVGFGGSSRRGLVSPGSAQKADGRGRPKRCLAERCSSFVQEYRFSGSIVDPTLMAKIPMFICNSSRSEFVNKAECTIYEISAFIVLPFASFS